jgi:mRNA interferase RelE/StbE
MQILYEKSFYKDIAKFTDKSINYKLLKLIESLKSINNVSEINSLRKMSGYANYYRIRIGDYRLGIKFDNNKITLIRFLHRREIYKYFP